LLLAGDGERLRVLAFSSGSKSRGPDADWVEDARPFADAARQLEGYFQGGRRQFELLLDPQGTEFQLRVWAELRRIPHGETISYGELARRIGNPAASRAVGLANGSNPIAIVIPCHRVVGSTGRLTGFGGGIEVKASLLALERPLGSVLAWSAR
jgi:methylated-DNA-[protein]-cysteine S-methyltransferase